MSLAWKRTTQDKARNTSHYNASLEQRVARLESELGRVVSVLLDTTELAEKNREHLLTLLRHLKDHK